MLREAVLAEAYARKYPDAPPFHTLSPKRKWEIRGYFESRGVIFNPHWGVTGRINGYAALRNFSLASEPPAELELGEAERADRAEIIAKRAEEQEEAEAEAQSAEEEELTRAAAPKTPEPRVDPAREQETKLNLAKLQKQWPPTKDQSPQAEAARHSILDQAIELLEPYAKMAAKGHMGLHFNEYDAEEYAHDALVAWKNKVLNRVEAIRRGETNSKGEIQQDAFVGNKLHSKRNLIADVGKFVFNVMRTGGKKAANRNRLAPMDMLPSEHQGERGVEEPPPDKLTTGEDPSSEIVGLEKEVDIIGTFRTLSRDLRRVGNKDAADLIDTNLKIHSNDDRELAAALSWPRSKLRKVRTDLKSYLDVRAKTHPELARIRRMIGEAAEQLCEKYPILNLLLEGHFLPTRKSKSMASIYERFAY
jgi:hypothetical protein